MKDGKVAEWQRVLEQVVAETNKEKLSELANELESAIFLRCQELECGDAAEAERQAIKEATVTLLKVRVEKLGFPLDPKILSRATRGGQLQE
jgi:hypothetical protein